ncbi:MAG: hypothetical protein IJZ42_07475 [Lachnospiraceae bacterium]|nr:hypothetical protein [Lachnospiraceae bacterium]
MSLFRELSQEEQDMIERAHFVKTQIAQLEIHKLEKRKEIEYFEEGKEMNYVPMTVWGILLLSQVFLMGLDMFYGFYNWKFNVAIMFASLTPILAIFFGIMFFTAMNKFILQNSKNQRMMKKAMDKGIENRWMRSAKLHQELDEINASLRVLKKEQNYLKIELQKIDEQ